jgi:hypothetical protein
MDLGLFLAGMVGAIAGLLLAKQTVFPRFRPFFDVTQQDVELAEKRRHEQMVREQIDAIRVQLRDVASPPPELDRWNTVIELSLAEVKTDLDRNRDLERIVWTTQLASMAFGILAYVGGGGVVGATLADMVTIRGFDGGVYEGLQALVAGAAWVAVLSLGQTPAAAERVRLAFASVREAVDVEMAGLQADVAALEPGPRTDGGTRPLASREGLALKIRLAQQRTAANINMQGETTVRALRG